MTTAFRCALAAALVVLAFPGATSAKPADVNVVDMPAVRIDPAQNTVGLDPSANTVRLESNTVKLDPSANTVQLGSNTVGLDPSANTVRLQSNAVRPVASVVTAIVQRNSLASGTNVCTSDAFPLPAGEPFVLDTVSADFINVRASHDPRAGIRLSRKDDDGDSYQDIDLPIPLDHESGFSTAAGTGHFGILIEPNSFASADPGDIYGVSTCLNRGSAADTAKALALLTGTPAG